MLKEISRFFIATLRGRLILSIALVHSVMMTLFIMDLTTRQHAMLLDRQIEEATALSQALATSSADWIAAHDISGLQELVEAQRRYPEIIFVLLADEEGRVLAATDKSRQGLFMLDLPKKIDQIVISGTPSLVDVVSPAIIGKHHVGWARVGIGQKMAGKKLAEITRDGIIYTLVAILIGSIIAWIMGSRITRRLYSVQKTIDTVRSGDRLARTPITGTDEAAILAREFNSMLDALVQRETELLGSEKRYRSLIQKVQTAIILHDSQGKILNANPMAQELLGLTVDQLLGKELIDPYWSFLREDGSIMALSDYPVSLVLSKRQPLKDYITGIRRPDRDPVTWVLVNAEPEYDDAGQLIQVIVSFMDITERKKAEKELQEQEKKSQSLLHLSKNLEQSQSYSEALTAAQNEVRKILGYQNLWAYLFTSDKKFAHALVAGGPKSDYVMSKEGTATLTITGDKMLEEIASAKEIVIVPDAQTDERVNKEIVTAMGNRTLINVPIILSDRHLGCIGTGTFGDEGVRIPSNSEQSFLMAMASHLAVTFDRIHLLSERMQADLALKESELRFRSMIENLTVGVLLQGPQSEILMSNPKSLDLLGLTEDQLMGKTSFDPDWNVIHEDGSPFPGPAHPVPQVIATKQPVRNVVMGIYRPKTKDRIWLLVDAEPWLSEDGSVRKVICTFNDITKRKQAEEEILKLNQKLEQRVADRTAQLETANKELEAFSYSVSHDLRSPLRHIDGFVNLLMEDYKNQLDEKGLHYLDVISKSTEKMNKLIEDLLSFSRMGRNDVNKVQMNLSDLVREIIQEFEPETSGRVIHWQIGEMPVVEADRALLHVVLVNLISNALKFTRLCPETEIEIGNKPNGDKENIFYVRDNGVGFDMKYADKLFCVFQRLHTADQFEGTGIGLANVRRVISRHGGRTWAEGKVDGGATLYFTLPLSSGK